MSCAEYIDTLAVQGCRTVNGVPTTVTQVFTYNKSTGALTATGEFSDGGTATEDGLGNTGTWIEGPCPETTKDPEVVCMTNDGGETVVKGVVIFSYDGTTWTSTLNNLDGTVATGYTVIPCVTNQGVEEGEARCDAGNTIIPFYDIETDGVASATIAFWFNPLTNSVVTPSGTQTPGACLSSTLSIGSELLNVSGVSTLTPTVGAVYAVISVNEGEAWITVDGTTPVVGDSHPAYEGQYVYLQIANELTDFKAIGNPTAKLYVTYYSSPLLLSQS